MCEPVSAGLMLGSMVLQGAGGIMQAKAQRESAEASNRYYNFLADNSDKQAGMVLDTADRQESFVQDQAARDAKTVAEKGRQTGATQQTVLAANGIVGGATAEDLARDTFDKSKMDELAIRYQADLKNYELDREAKFKAWDLKNQATGYRQAGANALAAGKINSTATLLGAAGSVGSSWATYKGK